VGELVALTGDALDAGARGVIYGRNVWQREDSKAVTALLRDVVHRPRRDKDDA
jgi:class I fructose-bisphosphate aldolase